MAYPRSDDPPSLNRLVGIYRRWKKAPRPRGRIPFRTDSLDEVTGRIGGLLGMVFAFALAPLTTAIRAVFLDGPAPPVPLLLTGPSLQGLFLATFVGNAVLLGRWLDLLTPHDKRPAPWIRRLRFLLAGVPLLGLYVIPAWRWLIERRRDGVSPRAPVDGPVPRGRAGDRVFLLWHHFSDRVGRRLATDVALAWLVVVNTILLLATIGPSGDRTASPDQLAWIAGIGVVLHLVVFSGWAWFLWTQAERHDQSGAIRILMTATAACWLVPVPYFALLGLVFLFIFFLFRGDPPRKQTLVRSTSCRDATPPRGWQQLRKALRTRRQSEPLFTRVFRLRIDPAAPRVPAWTDERLEWLYRVKTIGLAFETTGLAWVAMWIAHPHGLGSAAAVVMEVVAYLAFGLCVVGVSVVALYLARRAVGAAPGRLGVLDRHPYAQRSAASQFALAAGLLIGVALYRNDAEEIAAVLAVAGLLGCTVEFAGLLLRAWVPATERVRRTVRDEIFGLLGFLVLMLCGETMRRGELYDQTLVNWITALTVTAPLWGLVYVRVFSGWLLRPFDVGDALSRSTPHPLRRRLLVMTATLLLPLGGLFIPLWIFWRHRHLSHYGTKGDDTGGESYQ